jgi:DNA mismatch repair protein MutS2
MGAVFAESALAAIEFPAALDQVSQYAVTPRGAVRVRALRPSCDRFQIESELQLVCAMMERLAAGEDVEPVPFPDATVPLARLRLEGAVLDGPELAALAGLLRSARIVGAKLRRAARAAPILASLAAPPLPDELLAALEQALDDEGRVKDGASRDLSRLRRELIEVRAQIVATLERLLAGLDARQKTGDAGVTVRNGRYVVPLRRDARARLGGIVHDESATHATLFVEPPETIEMGNRLRSVEAEEAREVQRILRELTAALRPSADGLDAADAMLVATDAVYARARSAQKQDAVPPRVVDAGEAPLTLVRAAHPLLFGRGGEIVRFDLALAPGERTVLISGPNTGGKTVLIKAVGLAAALTQSGVLPAVGEGSILPVFDTVIADIGDHQSISESLSTFSAHVATLREVLDVAGPASLVLLDELGTGTDPAEGAALAGAILRALTRRGVTTVATTHLGALKELAGQGHGIVNASLAFDAATLAPTYRFTKGVPGRSYGLAIARRLGMSDEILREAETSLPESERRLDATLAAAEARGQALDAKDESLAVRQGELEMLEARLEVQGRAIREREEAAARRERELERAVKGAKRETLLEARAEVERAIASARAGQEKEARRALEERIAELHKAEVTEVTEVTEGTEGIRSETLSPGQRVRIRSLGIEGEIESVQGRDVAVKVRGRRVRVRSTDLSPASPPSPPSPPSRPSRPSPPSPPK